MTVYDRSNGITCALVDIWTTAGMIESSHNELVASIPIAPIQNTMVFNSKNAAPLLNVSRLVASGSHRPHPLRIATAKAFKHAVAQHLVVVIWMAQ
jgi:hypothetical protein